MWIARAKEALTVGKGTLESKELVLTYIYIYIYIYTPTHTEIQKPSHQVDCKAKGDVGRLEGHA